MKIKAYLALTKPRLTLMAVATASVAFYLAWPKRAPLDWGLFLKTFLGSALVGGGANALNQFLEKEEDSKMHRTRLRPLVSGEIQKNHALMFSLLLCAVGTLFLFIKVNRAAGIAGSLVLIAYLLVYTPLKKITTLNTYAGAVAGALPVFIGWTAAAGKIDAKAFSVFILLFIWQLPHFYAIAWVYREDYEKGGFRMLPLKDGDGTKTCRHIVLYSVLLFALSFAPVFTGLAGSLYFSAATISGLFFLAFALYTGTHKLHYVKEFIRTTILYLGVLNIFLLFDRI